MVTSLNSVSRMPSQSAKVMETSASPRGLRLSVPLNKTSLILAHRSAVGRCSPRTQRMASDTLLLPQPFGPTIAISPGSKDMRVRSAKLLKPMISSVFKYTGASGCSNRTPSGARRGLWTQNRLIYTTNAGGPASRSLRAQHRGAHPHFGAFMGARASRPLRWQFRVRFKAGGTPALPSRMRKVNETGMRPAPGAWQF